MSLTLGRLLAMKRAEFYLWWVSCERTGRRTKTRYRMERDVALARHPGATPVDGSLEVRDLPETDAELRAKSTRAWLDSK